jgi:hypothetical protein
LTDFSKELDMMAAADTQSSYIELIAVGDEGIEFGRRTLQRVTGDG